MTFLPPLPAFGPPEQHHPGAGGPLPASCGSGEPLPITFDAFSLCIERENRGDVLRLIEAIRLEERIEEVIVQRFREAAAQGAPVSPGSGQLVPSPEAMTEKRLSELASFPPEIAAVLAVDSAEVGEDQWLSAVWREYYRWLEQTGRAGGSAFLAEWAVFESGLREELAAFRLDRSRRTGCPRFSELIDSWARAAEPFAGERLLDRARWAFLEERCGVFSFSIDECVGYALRLRLLNRYQRLDRARGEQILREVAGL